MSKEASWTEVLIPTLAILLTGTVAGVSNKGLYVLAVDGDCSTPNAQDNSHRHEFVKPYFLTFTMFIGEALCLVAFKFMQMLAKNKSLRGDLLSSSDELLLESLHPDWKSPPKWTFAVLASFDAIGSSMVGVGLLWVSASTYQMLRGSTVVFVALFSMYILKSKLTRKQWLGIALVICGLIAVGIAATLGDTGGSQASVGLQVAGIFLILGGSGLNSLQNVLEEKLMKIGGGSNVHPMALVGWEGVFGIMITCFIILPIVGNVPGDDCGKQEDTLDTLHQLANSYVASLTTIAYFLSLGMMNFYSMELSRVLTAVHRNLVNATRVVLLWAVEVFAYYVITNQAFGESVNLYSLLQGAGFLFLIVGTLVYGKGKLEQTKPLDDDLHGDLILPNGNAIGMGNGMGEKLLENGHGEYSDGNHHNGNGYGGSNGSINMTVE